MRKPSGGERARFLEEESEPRNKRIFVDLCSKSIWGSKGVCPFGRRAKPEKGRQRALASVGRGKAMLFSLQGLDGENSRADELADLTTFETVTEMEMLTSLD